MTKIPSQKKAPISTSSCKAWDSKPKYLGIKLETNNKDIMNNSSNTSKTPHTSKSVNQKEISSIENTLNK